MLDQLRASVEPKRCAAGLALHSALALLAAAVLIALNLQDARAQCAVTSTGSVKCAGTFTTSGTDTNGATSPSTALIYQFTNGANINATIESGANISGGIEFTQNSPNAGFTNAGVSVNNMGSVTDAAGNGAEIDISGGSGNITYSGNGSAISTNTTGYAGLGIYAFNPFGSYTLSSYSGTVSIGSPSAPVTGRFSGFNGIFVGPSLSPSSPLQFNGNINIYLAGGSVTETGANGAGIFANTFTNSGTGSILINTTGGTTISGTSTGSGIVAYTASGNATINTYANIGTSAAPLGYGITANSTSGNITINTSGTIQSASDGVRASTGGNISVANSGSVSSNNANGIDIDLPSGGSSSVSYTGNGSARTSASAIFSGLGIYSTNENYSGKVSIGSATAPVTGHFSGGDGIYVGPEAGATGQFNGNISMYLAGGSASETAAGVISPDGSSQIRAAVLGDTHTNSGSGSVLISTIDNTIISGTSTGYGIAAVTYSGNASINTDANIGTAAQPLGVGIFAQSVSGQVNIAQTGGNIYSSVYGIQALSATGNITISTGGTIQSATDALYASTGGSISAANSGLLNGNVSLTGGNISATNSGLLNGNVSLQGGLATTFTNTGSATWITNGTDAFVGAGPATIYNNGTLKVSGPSTIAGAPTFNNSGVISLQNGTAANQLTLSGNYVGSPGSQLLVDVNPAQNTADKLIIAGKASGSTTIDAAYLTSGSLKSPLTIVQAGSGSTATFTLANPTNGLFSYAFSQSTPGMFTLASTPSAAAIAAPSIKQTAVQASQVAISGISQHLEGLRDDIQRSQSTSSSGRPLGYADETSAADQAEALSYQQNNSKQDPASRAIAMAVKAPAATPDLGPRPAVWSQAFDDLAQYTQSAGGINYSRTTNTGGLQAGFDETWRNVITKADALVLGFVASGTDVNSAFATGGHAFLLGPGIGAYGTYITGGFSVDGVVKNDWYGLSETDVLPGIANSVNLDNFNVAGNVQYKFDLGKSNFIEPTGGFVYTYTAYGPNATALGLEDGYVLRLQTGARFGTAWDWNNIHFEPSLLALIYDAQRWIE